MGTRILYVTSSISSPPSVGGEIRKWNILQGLLRAGEIDALVYSDGKNGTDAFNGCRKVFTIGDSFFKLSQHQRRCYQSTLGRGLLTLSTPLPFEYLGEQQEALVDEVRKQVDFSNYDLVWFATARAAVPLRALRSHAAATILDGDDFSYVREWMLLRTSSWYGAKLWNYLDVAKLWWWECNFTRQFSAVVRCSQEDAARHPAPNVFAIRNGSYIPPTINRAPERSVLFVGDLRYEPNVQGLEWLLRAVWPLIREQVPDACLNIVGKNPPEFVQATHGRDGVIVHGFVKDLATVYEKAGVSAVPLHAGGGTRLKILESLAYAVPVVSTAIGAFGIDADERAGMDRRDTPLEFAASCIRALKDPNASTDKAHQGRKFVQSHHDWTSIQAEVTALALATAQKASKSSTTV